MSIEIVRREIHEMKDDIEIRIFTYAFAIRRKY